MIGDESSVKTHTPARRRLRERALKGLGLRSPRRPLTGVVRRPGGRRPLEVGRPTELGPVLGPPLVHSTRKDGVVEGFPGPRSFRSAPTPVPSTVFSVRTRDVHTPRQDWKVEGRPKTRGLRRLSTGSQGHHRPPPGADTGPRVGGRDVVGTKST